MGKSSSSSSRKKNRSIASPPVHSKKISKSRRKKAKLKKLSRRQRHDSDHSSDDNSSSLLSASSSSYEDDEKSRRKKTKSKKLRTGRGRRRHHDSHYSSDDVASPSLLSSFSSSEDDDDSRRKSSKRKNTIHSYSSESSEDSLPKKRRKGFRKNVKSNVRKKYQKKRSKRHINLDTLSAGSSSCSTCKDGSSGSEESEFESSRMRSGRKDKKRRYQEDKKHGTRSRDSSRGYSCSQCEDISRGDENEERSISLYNSMRLRSVIVVRNYDEEERNMENDQHQSGDSCRANDGNGDGSIEKLDYPHVEVEVEVNGHVRSEEGEGVASTNRNTRDFGYGDGENQFDRSHPLSDKAASGDTITDDSNKTCNRSDINDLETMLRQRALENLKRFRGGAHSTAGMSVSSEEMNGSDKKSALDPSESSQSSTVTAGQLDGSKIADLRRNSSDTKLNIAASSGTKHLISNQSVVKGLHQVASVNNVQTKVNSTNTFNGTKPWITSYTWRRDLSSGHPISLGSQASQASSVKKVTAETVVDEKAYKTSKTKASVDKGSRRAKVHSTVGGLPLCTGSINEVKEEGKDEAKYDKKAASIVQDAELPVLDEKALRSPQIRACGVQTSNKDELASGAQNIDSCPHPVSVKAKADKLKPIDLKSEQMGDSVMQGNEMTKGSVDANSAVISKTAPECPTLTNSVSLDMKSDTVKKQDKDEPKYEQKTLSVMRGGEMVQVNYQVYIPKRTPALARRQLKR